MASPCPLHQFYFASQTFTWTIVSCCATFRTETRLNALRGRVKNVGGKRGKVSKSRVVVYYPTQSLCCTDLKGAMSCIVMWVDERKIMVIKKKTVKCALGESYEGNTAKCPNAASAPVLVLSTRAFQRCITPRRCTGVPAVAFRRPGFLGSRPILFSFL